MVRAIVAIAGLVAALPAPVAAQSVYKIVGPDGKITYSDHPPPSQATPVAVLPRSGASPPPAVAASRAAADGASGGDGRPGSAAAPGSPAPGSPGAAATAAANAAAAALLAGGKNGSVIGRHGAVARPVIDGLLGIQGLVEVAQFASEVCAKVAPAAPVEVAQRGWRVRNAQYVTQSERVMDIALDPAQRQAVHQVALARTQALFAPVLQADRGAQARWCEQAAADLRGGANDLRAKPALTDPVMGYRTP